MPVFENYTTSLAIFRRTDLNMTETAVAQAILSFRNCDDGRCNPAVFSSTPEKETICSRSKASRRCVLNAIVALEQKGVIRTTKLQGKTSGYFFMLDQDEPVQEVHPTRAPDAPHPCTSCTHNSKRTDKEQIKNKEIKERKERKENDLFADHSDDTPSVLPKRETAKRILQTLVKPAGVTDALWSEWVAYKKKRSKGCTQRMVDAIVREAETAGITTQAAMEIQLENGWVGFKAVYVQNGNWGRFSGTRKALVETPFDQRNYDEGINDDNTF